MKVKRLTKEEFIERVKDLWAKFYARMPDVTFEDFYSEALKEYNKQINMNDEELEKYRLKEFHKIVEEVNKNISLEEKEKFEKENMQIIDEEAIKKYAKKD